MRRLAIAGAASGALAATLVLTGPVLASGLGEEAHASPLVSLPSAIDFLADPTIAFGLLLLAMLGIGLEAMHPGGMVPGTIGIGAGLLAVLALVGLPLNPVGLLLLAVAAGLFVVDLISPSHGALSVAAMGAAIAGGVLMFPAVGVNPIALIGLPVVLGLVWVSLSRRALRVRHRPYPRQPQELLGDVGTVRQVSGGTAMALVDGELWHVEARDQIPLAPGTEVEVLAQDGLTLIVRVIGLPAPTPSDSSPGVESGVTARAKGGLAQ